MSNQSSNTFRNFDDVDSNTSDNDYHGHTLIFDSSIMHNFEDEISEEEIEGSDEEYEDCEDDIETDNDNNELINEDILIPESETCDSLTPCVLLEKRNGVVTRCGGTNNLRRIWNLIGAWELDNQAVDEVNKQVERLGVCYAHFMFDFRSLHKSGLKQSKSHEKATIASHRCIFCKKYYRVYYRGKECTEHCWLFLGKKTQAPCIGQHNCPAIESVPCVVQKTTEGSSQRPQYICYMCYELQGGHLHQLGEPALT